MITLKNSEIERTLITIAGYNKQNVMVTGLLTENITLALKRRLQKINTALTVNYDQFLKDKEDINSLEDGPVKDKELKTLMDETITLHVDKVSMAAIEAIQTKAVYDFDLIEKIAE
jgi:hypothetical protein